MPPSQTRSRSGCLTCKTKRKKCDETHPNCQRCERAGLQCPGYAYIDDPTGGKVVKRWTQPAYSIPPESLPVPARIPRSARHSRASSGAGEPGPSSLSFREQEATPMTTSTDSEPLDLHSTDISPDLFGSPFLVDPTHLGDYVSGDPFSALWNIDPSLLQFDPPEASEHQQQELYQQYLHTSQHVQPAGPETVPPDSFQPQYTSTPIPGNLGVCPPSQMTSGQASLFGALLSLSDPVVKSVPPPLPAPTNRQPSALLASPWSWSQEDDSQIGDDDEDEGVKQIICGTLALDIGAESNTLPFVLESYACWISRTAFEPRKAARGTRDLVLKHFSDSDDSRWTITNLASVVRALAKSTNWEEVWGESWSYQNVVSKLQDQVLQAIASVGKKPDLLDWEVARAVQVLDDTMEASCNWTIWKQELNSSQVVAIYYTTGRILHAFQLMRTAAPLFRRLCPDPPNQSICLQYLLLQPVISLRHYAIVDIFATVSTDRSMFFQYDTSYDPNLNFASQVAHPQNDVGLQWLHGIPSLIVIVFARINVLREQGIRNAQSVAEMEQLLKNFVPIPSVSNDSFLTVARLMVQECWRQVAYLYLYMGLCGSSADDARVKKALGRFMKLLDGTKPGHVPDAFLVLTFMIAGVAARREEDRQVIRRRMINSERFRYPGTRGSDAMLLLEYIWLRADGESRPAVWGDMKIGVTKATRA